MSNLKTLLEYLIREENMYHTTDPKNVPSILSKGLKINAGFDKGGKSRGSIDTMDAQYDGIQPIFLSKDPGRYFNGEILKVDIDMSELVADIPGLVDFGGELTDHSVYWDEENTPEELWDLADPETGESVNGELEYEDLRIPGPIADAAIDVTNTAAIMRDIEPSKIERFKTLQEIKRVDDEYEYDEVRFAKTPKKAKRIKTKTPKKQIGKLGEFKLFLVDGEYVRNHIDIDFVAGGNPARYAYCPEDEIWVEEVYGKVDIAATTTHEYHETILMRDHGKNYEKGHDAASKLEKKFRAWLDKNADGKSQKELIAIGLKASKKALDKKPSALNEAHLGKFNMDQFKRIATSAGRVAYLEDCHLPMLGEGSSRAVYALSTSKVLKIAKFTNYEAGKAQNEAEVSVWTNPETKEIAARIFDFSEDYAWIVMEIAKPFSNTKYELEIELEIPYPKYLGIYDLIKIITGQGDLDEFIRYNLPEGDDPSGYDQAKSSIEDYVADLPPFMKTLLKLIENNDLDPGDIHPGHFGKTVDGRIVLFDYGLTNEVYNTHYRYEE